MVNETRKIMGDDSIQVTASTVRVPVFYGHSDAVNIETEKPIDAEAVRALLADALQVPKDMITPDMAFGDLPQWDSLGHMEVMMRLEEQYGVEISPDTIASLISIPDICAHLENNHHGESNE